MIVGLFLPKTLARAAEEEIGLAGGAAFDERDAARPLFVGGIRRIGEQWTWFGITTQAATRTASKR